MFLSFLFPLYSTESRLNYIERSVEQVNKDGPTNSTVEVINDQIFHIISELTPEDTTAAERILEKLKPIRYYQEIRSASFILFTFLVNNWANSPKTTGNTDEAKKRILRASQKDEQILDLSDLNLSSIPECLKQLQALEEVNLNNNNLTTLPNGISKLKNLKRVHLFRNQLTAFPMEITSLSKLEILDLSYNQIRVIPVQINQFKHLKELALASNKIAFLPSEFSELEELESLDLQENKLHIFPTPICQLTKLEYLDLERNCISSIPAEISQLHHLKVLKLFSNAIRILPEEIGHLFALQELYLTNNQILRIPSTIGNLYQLVFLDFSHNKDLKKLPLSLGNLPEIIMIYTEKTQILEEEKDLILQRCRAAKSHCEKTILPMIVEHWKFVAEHHFDASLLKQISDDEQIKLCNWLKRLEGTQDFNTKTQKTLTATVLKILDAALKDKEFKQVFFNQIESNLEACADRAAQTLNELYTYWRLSTTKGLPKHRQVKVLAQCAKTAALRKALANAIGLWQIQEGRPLAESVEVYLYYELKLKKPLNLLTFSENMLFEEVGERDWIDEDTLKEYVKTNYLDELLEMSQLDQILPKTIKNHSRIIKLKKAVEYLVENPSFAGSEQLFLDKVYNLNQEIQKTEKSLRLAWVKKMLTYTSQTPSRRKRTNTP